MDSFVMHETVRKKAEKDVQFSRFICAYYLFNAINSTLQVAFGITGTTLNAIKIGIQLVLLVILVIAVNRLCLRKFLLFIYGELIAAAFYGVNLLVVSDRSIANDWFITIFTSCVPICVAVYLIEEKEVLYQMFLRYSWPIFAVSVINFIFSDTFYDMHFSYIVILVVLIHFTEWKKKSKVIYLITAIIGLLMILIHGSRGALLCPILFVVVKIFYSDKPIVRRISLAAFFIVLSVIVIVMFRSFSNEIYRFLVSIGVKGRSVTLLFSNSFISYDSERSAIWETTIRLINEKPITGWGIAGAATELSASVAGKGAIYPHQLFLDLFLTFGYLFGFVANIFVIIIFAVVVRNSSKSKDLSHIFISYAFPTLMFSSTIFTFVPFYIVLGMGLSFLRKQRTL